MKCCEAPEATTKMSDGANMCDTDKVKGWIDQVTVEVCRPAAGEKIPFVIIRYYGVKVTNYEVSITEPEPSETIKFEFEELELEYQQTDPFTGARKGGATVTKRLTNRPASQNTTSGPAKGGSGAASPGASPDGSGGAVSAGTGASAAVAVAASNGNGSSAALVSATDGAVRANFPALWSENGFGLLPD
jgi:hypothetical protein